jgi:glutathione S-transferase
MNYVDVDVARTLPGVRLVLTVGFPGPWGQSVKKMLELKSIAYVPVAQYAGQENAALRDWLGIRNAPVIVSDDQPPLSTWLESIMFAERRAPEPALLPSDSESRSLVFGIVNEIAGDRGFGWCRRLMLFDDALRARPELLAEPTMREMIKTYEVTDDAIRRAPDRIVDILGLLARRLTMQRAAGQHYLVGDVLTAADVYWACFSTMLEPLPDALCKMSEELRSSRTPTHPAILAAKDPVLLEHRDRMFERHLGPLEF